MSTYLVLAAEARFICSWSVCHLCVTWCLRWARNSGLSKRVSINSRLLGAPGCASEKALRRTGRSECLRRAEDSLHVQRGRDRSGPINVWHLLRVLFWVILCTSSRAGSGRETQTRMFRSSNFVNFNFSLHYIFGTLRPPLPPPPASYFTKVKFIRKGPLSFQI